MANKKQSTAELIGISHFSRNGLMTKRYGEVVYFIVQPTNISVLSETSIAIKINHLMQLLSEQPDIEIICSDARENFEYNKLSLARKAEKEEKLNALSDAKYNDGQKKNLNNEIASIDKRIKESNEIIKESGKDVITLSGSMFMLIEPEIIYLSSGNYEEYMKFNSQYLIQWELIKYGIENGFKKHNFYGIPANINEHPKDYGIYEFKRGFNGYVEELIGEYSLPITWHYSLFKLIHKIKK